MTIKNLSLSILSLAMAGLCGNAQSLPSAAVKMQPKQAVALAKNTKIDINGKKSASKARKAESTTRVLWESFENPTDDRTWLPDGWTRISNSTFETETDDHWVAYYQLTGMPEPTDGNKYMIILFNSEYKDEWIVSPSFEVGAGQELAFDWWGNPTFFYVIDNEHIDFENMTFIKREVTIDFEVHVKAEGDADWTKIYSMESNYSQMTYQELHDAYFTYMKHFGLSLDDYAGKKIQVAFRYVGADGDSMCMDAVSVGFPSLDALYQAPVYRQYYGFTPTAKLSYMPASIELYPANTPLTWYNISDNTAEADYLWEYKNRNESGQMETFTSDDPDALTVIYRPDYSSEATIRDNHFSLPTLTASSPKGTHTAASYTDPAYALQAGGKPEYLFSGETEYISFNLLPFDILTEEVDIYTKDELDFGRPRIPIFGYSEDTREWWRNYTFAGEPEEDEDAYCVGYMNWVHVADSPLLVRGASAAALGRISDEANFRLEVRVVNESGEIVEEPIKVAYLSGKDALIEEYSELLERDIIVLNFKFDEPLVLDSQECPNGYLFEVTGYAEGGVTYFAPLQSVKPNPYEWCLGFYRHYRKYMGVEDTSYSYVANFTNEYGDLYSSFAIGLDASYEWFDELENNALEVDENGLTLPLGTSVDGSEFTVEAPEWLDVEITGQYDKAQAVFKVVGSTKGQDTGKVILSAPGLRDVILIVTAVGEAGIDAVDTDATDITRADVYNTMGSLMLKNATKEQLEALPEGLYLHGNKKIIVKH